MSKPKTQAKAVARPTKKAAPKPAAKPKATPKAEPKATPITDKVKAIIAGAQLPAPEPTKPEPKPADPDLWTELDFGQGDVFRIESRADDRCALLKATMKDGEPTGWKPIGGEMDYLTDALRRIADVLDGKPIG